MAKKNENTEDIVGVVEMNEVYETPEQNEPKEAAEATISSTDGLSKKELFAARISVAKDFGKKIAVGVGAALVTVGVLAVAKKVSSSKDRADTTEADETPAED